MRRFARVFSPSLLTLALLALAPPAHAGRTAIDQDEDGNSTSIDLAGYCDLDGSDCTPSQLSYEVSIGGNPFSNFVTVHGNGLLSFGGSINFAPFVERIQSFEAIDPTEYGVTLVDAGQSNDTDFQNPDVFLQSATLMLGGGGVIQAEYFTCNTPTFCHENAHSVTLTPTFSGPGGQSGFLGLFDFSQGSGGGDVGYVVNGQFTPTGNSFFLPAAFRGLDQTPGGVPEPASWALLLLGFFVTGGTLRARSRTPAPLPA